GVGQPGVGGHRAALKAFDAAARRGGLTLAAATAGLAGAGADAAADAMPFLARTRTVGKFVKFHGRLLSHSLSCSLSWPGSSRPLRVPDACTRENADARPKAAHDELFLLVLVHAHEVV